MKYTLSSITPMATLAFLAALILYYLFRKMRGALVFIKPTISKKKAALWGVILLTVLFLPALWEASSTIAVLIHLVAFLLLTDLIVLLIKLFSRSATCPKALKLIYKLGLPALLATAIVMGYAYHNIFQVLRTEYTVQANAPFSRDYKIILFSDSHYGMTLDKEGMQSLIDRIQSEDPDLVLLAGDIVDEYTTAEEMEEIFEVLGSISSTYGTYYVYGNHDTLENRSSAPFTQERLKEVILQNGIGILEDDSLLINNELLLVGRADRSMSSNQRGSIQELMTGAADAKATIVLDHQPAEYDLLSDAGVTLVLSGHTHGGQMFPMRLMAQLMNSKNMMMMYGCEQWGDMTAIVTSGVSSWGFPFRTASHSEYVVIQFTGL